jgi:hypothetical protein
MPNPTEEDVIFGREVIRIAQEICNLLNKEKFETKYMGKVVNPPRISKFYFKEANSIGFISNDPNFKGGVYIDISAKNRYYYGRRQTDVKWDIVCILMIPSYEVDRWKQERHSLGVCVSKNDVYTKKELEEAKNSLVVKIVDIIRKSSYLNYVAVA